MKSLLNMLDFYDVIKNILRDERVQELDFYVQHMGTSRLQHSLNVSYYSYVICKKLRLDYCAAARAGLLHDFYCYDWRSEKQEEGAHASAHPKVALKNAQKIVTLTPIEADAIVNHMWPLTFKKPCYAEGFVVSMADKYSACVEIYAQMRYKIHHRWVSIKTARTPKTVS